MNRKILFYCFLLFCIAKFNAQEYYFRHYKVQDGLSHNSVLCSLEDHWGFMWFGTKDGLNRFDGYTFKVYQSDPDKPKSLGSNIIQCLTEFKNKIWVGTENGLYSYDEDQEDFDFVPGTANLSILDLQGDRDGNLWFVGGNTLFKYNPDGNNLKPFDPKKYFEPSAITQTESGTIWVSSFGSLYKYSGLSGNFQQFPLNILSNNGLPFIITTVYAWDETSLLIGTQNQGAFKYNSLTKKTSKILNGVNKPLYVRKFNKKDENTLWIATETGIYIQDSKAGTYVHLQKNYNNPYTLSDDATHTITQDSEGGMWVGTYFGGVNYYPKPYSPFTKYFPKIGENSLSGNVVREIHPDSYGNLWIGTEDHGLNKLDPSTGHFTNFEPSASPYSISYKNIHGLLPRKDKLWIGTFEHGLDILDIPTGKVIKHYGNGDQGSLLSNFVFKIYETKANKVLVLTALGIQAYNQQTDRFEDVEGFGERYFYTAFLEAADGSLWAGTYRNGLYRYDPKTGQKTAYSFSAKGKTGISSNAINGVFQDSVGRIWITTENGLNRFDAASGTFTRFSLKNGFPSNVFYSIIEDAGHALWISTSNGLVEFYPETQNLKIYTKANGLLSDQFNYNSAYKAEDGTMYFGSVDGMVSFNPQNFRKNTYKPPILITGLQIDNREVLVNKTGSPLQKSITGINAIELKNKQSSFSIDFATLSYAAPEMTHYWYKLEGLNSEWIDLGRNHKVYFTQLAAGDYEFSVKSLSRFGVVSALSAPLSIGVLPPFYASWWAYILYFLLIIALFIMALRYFHNRTKAKNELRIKQLNTQKEREVYQAKIEFFTNVAHEIRTPLTLIKAPLEKILTHNEQVPQIEGDLRTMDKNTSRLLDLVNQLLDFRKTEMAILKLTFVEVNISALIKNTVSRFGQVIDEKNIDLSLDLGAGDFYAYVDEEAVTKIISNLINNAVKYAAAIVSVSLEHSENTFTLKVKNDGTLIPAHFREKIFEPFFRVSEFTEQSGSGIGLSLAHSLTQLHSGRLTMDAENPKLNAFMLTMPVHQENEFQLYGHHEENMEESKALETIAAADEKNALPNVLLVENNEDLLQFLSEDLSTNYYIFKSTSAEGALKRIKAENIHLVVSDVMMEGMDGFDLCQIIKTNLETSHIPVILLTAKDALNAKIKGLESGADAYIPKPFSIEHLRVQIYNLMENRRHIMEHYSTSPLSHIRSIAHSKTDEAFIKRLDGEILENMSKNDLSVEALAENMGMSRSTLYRKIKDISNLSPNELINITRLKRAAELLRTGDYKIYEVAELVGYNSPTNFGRNFQKQFNRTPSEYMKGEGY